MHHSVGKSGSSDVVTVHGVVTAGDWEDDRVVLVVICTDREEEIRVDGQHRGPELFGCIKKEIRARGVVYEDAIGQVWMTVRDYEVLGI